MIANTPSGFYTISDSCQRLLLPAVKNCCLIFSLILASMGSWAQHVIVLDADSNEPIPGVQVYNLSRSSMVTSDASGKVDVSKFSTNDSIIFKHVALKSRRFLKSGLSNGLTVRMTTRTLMQEEFVVGASRFRENRDDIAQSVEAISSKAIEYESSQTTADLLANSPTIFVQKSQGGGGSPILRGFEANKVLLVVDGVRMNNTIFRSGHLQNVLSVDQGVMERVEVIQGPGSVVYGSEALGGVIHLRTKDPILNNDTTKRVALKTNTYSRFSSVNNELTGHIDFSFGFKKWGSLTSVTFSDFKDLRMGNVRNPFSDLLTRDVFHVEQIGERDTVIMNENRNIQDESGYNQIDALQKLIYIPSDKITHRINFQFSTTSDVPRYDRLQQVVNGKPRYAEWYYGPQDRIMATYGFNARSSTKMFDYVNLVAGYQRVQESRHSRRLNSTLLESNVEDVDVGSINMDFSKAVDQHLIRYGLEGTYNHVTSTGSIKDIYADTTASLTTRYPKGGTDVFSGAVYLSHSWSITRTVKMQEGIRYNFNRLTSDFGDDAILNFAGTNFIQQNSAVNGSLGFVFSPGKGWNIKLLGATGFRSPNLDDLGKVFDPADGDLQIPNPDLRPTYLYSGELSVSKQWENGSHVGVVGYYSYLNDAIVRTAFQYEGQDSITYNGERFRIVANQNAQNAFITGASFNMGFELFNGLAFTGSVTYTYGRILGDSATSPLDHIPPLFGRVGLLYKYKKFRAEVFSNWSDWKHLEDYNIDGSDNLETATSEGMPAWYTLNARVSYKLLKSVSIQLGLMNILDQNFRMYGSDISAPGRNFTVTLRASI